MSALSALGMVLATLARTRAPTILTLPMSAIGGLLARCADLAALAAGAGSDRRDSRLSRPGADPGPASGKGVSVSKPVGSGFRALVVVVSLTAGCGDLDVVTNTYADMAEARAAGAIERRWVPRLVPSGAYDIREAHEGDGGRRWGLFSFRPGDDEALRGQLGAEVPFAGLAADAPPRIEWWPVALRGSLDAERVAATGLQAYPVAGEDLVAAVNWKQRRAYYWSPRSPHR